jgi:hypothetical protein
MVIQEPKNKNYAAIVVELSNFVDLPNCDNVKSAMIFGNSVIVSKGLVGGEIGLYFPVESQLSKEFAGANNLFRKPEWGNADRDKKGFFEEHGRVRAVKFRGHKSEGFWIPLDSLAYTGLPGGELPVGAEFDKLGDHEICCKYIPAGRGTGPQNAKQGRQPRLEDQIVDGQFRFHIDTENLRRNIDKIEPHMWISISDKWHGSSAVFANILVKRELRWHERLLARFGVKISDQEYGYTWSSRRVVKGIAGSAKANSVHFYGTDIWGVVAKEIESLIPRGYTIYGEIVGYTQDGGVIQKGYHYGCQPKTHRFVVYRVTSTNADGKVLELSWRQLTEFCARTGLEMVREYWHGRAGDFYPESEPLDAWQRGFLAKVEKAYVQDQMCPHNNGEVPSEGVVVRVDALDEAPAFKVKSFKFLEWESKQLDSGEADIESAQDVAL